MGREFEALRFAAGKSCRGLSQTEIAEADFIENVQFAQDPGHANKELQCFADRQSQNLVDILVAKAHFEHAALEARAPAFLADQLDVRQELHLDGDRAVALASLAAASRDVEGKGSSNT